MRKDTARVVGNLVNAKRSWISFAASLAFSFAFAQSPALIPMGASDLTHGPMLGGLTSSSVRVWVRTRRAMPFMVRHAESADFRNSKLTGGGTRLDQDFTGHAELRGLKPNAKYYYQIEINRRPIDTQVGGRPNSFTTLPHADQFRHPQNNPRGLFNFRFEHGSCASQNPNQHDPTTPAYATMLRELKDKVHFQIMNGDWLYEEARDLTAEQYLSNYQVPMRHPVVDILSGITGVWENYKLYLTRSKNLANFHREIPFFITFDDHEILNDVYGCGEVGLRTDGRRPQAQGPPGRATHEGIIERAVFRDPALHAWRDYLGWANPPLTPSLSQGGGPRFGKAKLTAGSSVLVDVMNDFSRLFLNECATLHVQWGQGNTGVYEIVRRIDRNRLEIRPAPTVTEEARYSIGTNYHTKFRVSNCEFFLLDTRSHRTLHDPERPIDPNATMIGKRQLKWLMDEMSKSDADFFFIASSVTFTIPHVGSGGATVERGKDDAWTAHLQEREQLVEFFESLKKPVFILTGDLHNCFVVQITPGVWEMSAGPHNSTNHRNLDAGSAPANGWFDSRGRKVKIRWSTTYLNDVPRNKLHYPNYCVVQVNNVYNSPDANGNARWVAYPHPQVVFNYHDGLTGELKYAESVSTMDAQ